MASALTLNQSLLRVFFRAFSPNIIISCSFGHSALPKTSKFSKKNTSKQISTTKQKMNLYTQNPALPKEILKPRISFTGISRGLFPVQVFPSSPKPPGPRLRRSHRSNSATAYLEPRPKWRNLGFHGNLRVPEIAMENGPFGCFQK